MLLMQENDTIIFHFLLYPYCADFQIHKTIVKTLFYKPYDKISEYNFYLNFIEIIKHISHKISR